MPNPEAILKPPAGHPRVLRTLMRSLAQGTAHHAYLFEGPAGVGKAAMARYFAAGLLCEALAKRPCGACVACRGALRDEHPDLLHLAALPDKKSIVVDQVRELIRTIQFRPLRGARRVILIHDCDRMAAVPSNALLKTLEEPAPYNSFILLTARAESLLDTIRSRCLRIRFQPLPRATVLAELIAAGEEPEAAGVLAGASAGSLGLAEALRRVGFVGQAERWLDRFLTPAFVQPRAEDAATVAEALDEASEIALAYRKRPDPATSDLALILRALSTGLRDALLLATDPEGAQLTWARRRAAAEALARGAGAPRLVRALDAVHEAAQALERPLNARLVLESLLVNLLSLAARAKAV